MLDVAAGDYYLIVQRTKPVCRHVQGTALIDMSAHAIQEMEK